MNDQETLNVERGADSVQRPCSAKIRLSEYSKQKGREAYMMRKAGNSWKAIATQQGCSVSIARCHFRKWERHIGSAWSNRTLSPNDQAHLPAPAETVARKKTNL